MDRLTALELLRSGPLRRSIVFGSFGLALHGLRSFDAVPDLDVVAAMDDAHEMGCALLQRGFDVRSWDAPFTADLGLQGLQGRIYLRATSSRLQVDITYEGVDIDEWRRDAVVIDGVTVATVERIERQRAIKASGAP